MSEGSTNTGRTGCTERLLLFGLGMRTGLRGLRILLVDDEPAVRCALAMLLRELFGCVVTEAGDGEEGLRLFQPGEFDVVFTDYLMPGMNGAVFAERVRDRCPTQRIIMVTAYPSLGATANLDFILRKPCTAADLGGALDEVLNRQTQPQPHAH